ncbi:GntR family transcriptional regulator [Corynebacterium mayonis]|uniref:GntR family transcriptional regulator n=1 Tax=Corynebacterium mayonis TaxID=3062461 RepID=UPI003140821E
MSGKPIYERIADELQDLIASGELAAGQRVPSTNELSHFHSVNPTTSAKALTTLLQAGLVEKRRGLGMFVLPGAREQVLAQRRAAFTSNFLSPLLREAEQLGITTQELTDMITKGNK